MSRYQVVILGSECAEAERFRVSMRRQFQDLQIDESLLSFSDAADVADLDRKSPTVGVYFGLEPTSATTAPGLSDLLADGRVVIPVVADLDEFRSFVPESLHAINGYRIRPDDGDFLDLCGLVMENHGLLRRSRRIFISYRRSESQAVAIQLYEELDRRSFDVFLDTLAIRAGEPFQEVLWHRLADTDVMVLLDSPGFLQNRWTEAELARANSTSIQILQVVWPDNQQTAETAFSADFILCPDDFQDAGVVLGSSARLRDETADRIALAAEGLRARALAARQAYLVQEMVREADDLGVSLTVQPGRYLELDSSGGNRAIIVPTVGLPDALRYQEIEEDIADEDGADLLLVYDERGVRERWIKHLNWLDPRMRVRSLPIGAVRGWLSGRVGK